MTKNSEEMVRERINQEASALVAGVLEKLKHQMKLHHGTVSSCLRTAGVSESFFRDLRRGKTGEGVTLVTIVRISLALGIHPRNLFNYEDPVTEALRGAVLDPRDNPNVKPNSGT